MSLRKSTRLTPARLEAARRNAQRSTGPRSQAGKQRVRMNALKHGCDAAPENEAAVMRALGEDPARYAALKRDLMSSYGPGDALWDQQLEDLAKLYWRRNRIERMETGLMRRALEALEERGRERRQQIAAATFDACHGAAMDIDLGEPTDPAVRLRLLLSLLGVLRQQVRQRVFKPRQRCLMETYYRGEIGWRAGRLCHLLWLFVRRVECERQGERELHEFVSEYFEGGEAGVESHYQELLALLEEEIADVEEESKHEVKAQEDRDAIERDACLAPAGEAWEMLLRQEAALDRSIDRKVRIILTMRKEHAQQQKEAARPPEDEPNDREAEELGKLAGLDARSESWAEENAGEISKSREQSENVLENKASAGQALRAEARPATDAHCVTEIRLAGGETWGS
jgi:hypothetical protein